MTDPSLSTHVSRWSPSLVDSGISSSRVKLVPLRASIFVLCVLWFWLFCCLWPHWSLYESYQYGCFVPFIVVALCWKRWLNVPEPDTAKTRLLPALVAVVAAVPLLPA